MTGDSERGQWPAGWTEELHRILRRVEKPGRYIGGEWNEVRKPLDTVRVTVGLVFPDVYEIGMSYLGQKILYALLNARPDVAAERVFAPWPDMERELRIRNMPLFTLENKIPLHRLDILAFSLLYELNDSGILTVLDLGGIPLRAAERSETDPLVIAGGPAAFNPEPLAEVIDVFIIGDGEEAFLEVIDLSRALKEERASREAQRRAFSRMRGAYVPALYRTVRCGKSPLLIPRPADDAPAKILKRSVGDFSRSFFPRDIIVPEVQAVFDRVAVEAARGCPHRCRFCQATSLYFPYRVKHPGVLVETILESVKRTGFQDTSLSALSIGDYPFLDKTARRLMEELSPQDVSLSLSSLRPKGLTAGLADSILKVRKTGFTLVPEAGTERLRRVINKELTDDDIHRAVEVAFKGGWRLLKLYFMIGLPGERQEDLEALVRIVRDILLRGEKTLRHAPLVNISLSSFIPKPHTPFQWLAMEEVQSLQEKQRFIIQELKRNRSVKIKAHPVESSSLEAVFSRGDRRLFDVLRTAWGAGARFEGWKDNVKVDVWRNAFAQVGLDPRSYLGALDLEAELPWDHIDTGLKKEHLAEELRRALREEPTPSCLETSCGDCLGCRLEFRPEKTFAEEAEFSRTSQEKAGDQSQEPVRYRAFYEKSGRARYLAHNDLINILRRSFRRAGISVLHTGGFHPKMRMSFLPAMPLGMAGLEEALEFLSGRLMGEEEFLERVNRNLPEGIRFSGLKKMSSSSLRLSQDTAGFVYSLDLKNKDVRAALADRAGPVAAGETNDSHSGRSAAATLRRALPEEVFHVFLAPPEEKIYFRISLNEGKTVRIQDAVFEALGLEAASFFLTRESVAYHSEQIDFKA